MVECPTTDPKVVGSNSGGAEIGIHIFLKPHIGNEYWFIQEAVIESGLHVNNKITIHNQVLEIKKCACAELKLSL